MATQNNFYGPHTEKKLQAITDILNSRRSITADTALRLALYFGNSAQFWLDLQSQYDIAIVERKHGAEIKKRVHPANAA